MNTGLNNHRDSYLILIEHINHRDSYLIQIVHNSHRDSCLIHKEQTYQRKLYAHIMHNNYRDIYAHIELKNHRDCDIHLSGVSFSCPTITHSLTCKY